MDRCQNLVFVSLCIICFHVISFVSGAGEENILFLLDIKERKSNEARNCIVRIREK